MANQLLDQFDLKKDTEEITIPAKRNTGNSLLDQFNNDGGNYTSTTKTPEKKAGYIVSAGAGILSGAEKAVEGVVTTGTAAVPKKLVGHVVKVKNNTNTNSTKRNKS